MSSHQTLKEEKIKRNSISQVKGSWWHKRRNGVSPLSGKDLRNSTKTLTLKQFGDQAKHCYVFTKSNVTMYFNLRTTPNFLTGNFGRLQGGKQWRPLFSSRKEINRKDKCLTSAWDNFNDLLLKMTGYRILWNGSGVPLYRSRWKANKMEWNLRECFISGSWETLSSRGFRILTGALLTISSLAVAFLGTSPSSSIGSGTLKHL